MSAVAGRAAAARRRRVPLLLALPAAAAAAIALLPLAYLAVRASSRDAWASLDASGVAALVLDTLLLVAGVVAAGTAIAVPLAWLVTRTDLPGRRVWAVAAALPLVIPSYVAALVLLGALGPRGLLQQLLERVAGVERLPELYGYPGALLALTLSTYPYVFLLATAALRSLDPSVEEAARGLGSSRIAAFFRVTLPALRPAVAAGGLLAALYTLADFGAVSLMQYHALTRAIYLQYQALFAREPAAALSLVLVALALVFLAAETVVRQRARYYRSGPGTRRDATPVRLGRWRWAALAFCAAVVGVFLVLPLGVLVYWAADRSAALASAPALNSLLASAAAAAAAVLCALPVAFLANRHRRPWTRALERVVYTGNALPGIVVALALVFFAARHGWLYQTLTLLVLAYVVRFLPQAVAGVGSSFETINPRLEDAARGLGRRPLNVFATVTVPLAAPGILAGAALVFLSAMKELPATLLLRPIGFDTLATEIWTETSVAAYSSAARPALLLIAVSAPVVYVLLRRGESAAGVAG